MKNKEQGKGFKKNSNNIKSEIMKDRRKLGIIIKKLTTRKRQWKTKIENK